MHINKADYKERKLLNKPSEIINNCSSQNKLHNSKDYVRFSITTFKQPSVENHNFPKSYYFLN